MIVLSVLLAFGICKKLRPFPPLSLVFPFPPVLAEHACLIPSILVFCLCCRIHLLGFIAADLPSQVMSSINPQLRICLFPPDRSAAPPPSNRTARSVEGRLKTCIVHPRMDSPPLNHSLPFFQTHTKFSGSFPFPPFPFLGKWLSGPMVSLLIGPNRYLPYRFYLSPPPLTVCRLVHISTHRCPLPSYHANYAPSSRLRSRLNNSPHSPLLNVQKSSFLRLKNFPYHPL